MELGMLDGKHYSEYSDHITNLVKSEEYNKAKELLLQIITIMEDNSLKYGEGVAPWYYEKLSQIYRKLKDKESEKLTLLRFLTQVKAGGKKPRKLYEKYIKINDDIEEKTLQNEIYKYYEQNIEKSKMKLVKKKCSNCEKIAKYPVPISHDGKEVDVFTSSCPYCCISDFIGVK